MAYIKNGEKLVPDPGWNTCGSKEQGEKQRDILSPSVNNMQLGSVESGLTNQNYFKFGVRKSVSRGRNQFHGKGKSIKTLNTLQQRTSSKGNQGSKTDNRQGEWKPLGM
jgi:hypothetical protein